MAQLDSHHAIAGRYGNRRHGWVLRQTRLEAEVAGLAHHLFREEVNLSVKRRGECWRIKSRNGEKIGQKVKDKVVLTEEGER